MVYNTHEESFGEWLTTSQFEALVMRVSAELEYNSISRLIPHETAKWLRDSVFGRGMQYQYVMPLAGSNAMTVLLYITIAGEIRIELADMTGERFWNGTLKEMKE